MIYPTAPIAAQAPTGLIADALNAGAAVGNGFEQRLERAIGSVNDQVSVADLGVQKLALGEEGSLHGVMIALENARLSLSLMVQVRNRLVEAYQDLARMQV